MTPTQNKNCRPAAVLILVLIVIATMTLLCAGIVYRTRIELRLANGFANRSAAYLLALAGIEIAKSKITADPNHYNNNTNDEDLFQKFKNLKPAASIQYRITDELSLFNINCSDPAAWQKLQNLDPKLIPITLDWTDADDIETPGGAENTYYLNGPAKYAPSNKNIKMLRELMFLKDISPETYYSDDKQNPSQTQNLTEIFTVQGIGKFNINTCPAQYLATLPGIEQASAQKIVSYRQGPDNQTATADDHLIQSTEDIQNLPGLTTLEKDLLCEYCCFNSNYFRIYSTGTSKGVTCKLMATLMIQNNEITVICVENISR